MKILFTSANPSMDLKLDEEYQAIEEAISQSDNRENVKLIPKISVHYRFQ